MTKTHEIKFTKTRVRSEQFIRNLAASITTRGPEYEACCKWVAENPVYVPLKECFNEWQVDLLRGYRVTSYLDAVHVSANGRQRISLKSASGSTIPEDVLIRLSDGEYDEELGLVALVECLR